MLTEKCPYCGSYNDVQASECYYCHKELPDQPGKPKKKRNQKPASQNITFSAPATALKRKSPPGCLVLFSGLLVALSLFVVFEWVNGAYNLVKWKIPFPATAIGVYVSFYLNGLAYYAQQAIQYPIPVVVSIVMLLILCWGMLNLRQWARTLALILLIMLLVGNFVLFGNLVMHYSGSSESQINFLLSLGGILVNAYCVLWFFEHKKTFN